MKAIFTRIVPFALTTLLVGCANFSPDYSRPDSPIAATINGEVIAGEGAGNADNVDNTKVELKAWQAFFPNKTTKDLIALALENNRDLRIATANVAEAEGMFQIQRQDLMPSLSLAGSGSSIRNSNNLSGTDNISRSYGANIGLASYELDFWGRVRNLNAAALASYFGTLEAQRSSKLTVISSTANAYSNWLAARETLLLAEQTLVSREKSYELIKLRESIGIASTLDLTQAEVAKVTIEAQKAQSLRVLSNAQAALELLVGMPISDVLKAQEHQKRGTFDFVIPENLNSSLILSRPDVIAAEEALIAANANIGAARAAFFPSITLAGSSGFSSGDLDNLFNSESRTWSFTPNISIPLFGNGNLANLDVAKARKDKRIAEYEKVIQNAFSEVYTNVNARKARAVEIDANQRLVKAQDKRLGLATARYEAGVSNYIEVLDAKENLFAAQQSLLEAERGEAESIIQLYRALGGGDDITASFREQLSN